MSQTVVNIADVIDRRPVSRFQWIIYALALVTIFVDGFDTQAIGYVGPLIIKAFGVSPAALSPVFSAGLVGIMIGSLVLAPLADYVGRRRLIILSMAFCGVFSLATVTVQSLDGLLALRFLTGLSIGGSLPNLVALTDEFAPRRRRAGAVMLLICGISFGSIVGGFVAAQLSSHFGWRSVFWVGGVAPFAILALLLWKLPESPPFLAKKGGEEARIAAMLRRIDPDFILPAGAVFAAPGAERLPGLTVTHLFREGRGPSTLLVWTMYFMGLLNIFFMSSWLPTILTGLGHSLNLAVALTALFNGSGIIGTFLAAWTEGRRPIAAVLGVLFLIGGGLIGSIGLALDQPVLLLVAVGLAGFCLVGAQNTLNAVAAHLYPTSIRATGVGWAYGVGRAGSIVGPLVGGLLLALHWPPRQLFFLAALPALCAAAAGLTLYMRTRRQAA